MEEKELIQQAKKGDLESFNQLVLKFEKQAFNIAYRIAGDMTIAEDATQNAFIKAYKKLTSFRGDSFRAWLFRIVSNACYDELRKVARQPQIPLELEGKDGEMFEADWMRDPGESPQHFTERLEMAEAIQFCIDQLDENFKLVLILVDLQGLDYGEASQVAGSALGTVKSRLARGRKKVQECLQGFQELLPQKYRLQYEAKL